MIKRPTKDDSEEEILRMQREFLAEKRKNKDFQPAAQVVKVGKVEEQKATEPTDNRSEFAKRRNIKKQKIDATPKQNVMVGDIIERSSMKRSDYEETEMEIDESGTAEAFPKPIKFDLKQMNLEAGPSKKVSLFGQALKKRQNCTETTDVPVKSRMKISERSMILQGTDAQKIHEENVETLKKMSEEEILKERAELLQNIDPSLVQFLKLRREKATGEKMESCGLQSHQDQDAKETTQQKPKIEITDEIPVLDILKQNASQNWLHFDVLEPEKLEWTKDLDKNIPKLKSGEKYEARFDWKGVLLPYDKETKQEAAKDNRELYLHGDEAHRPGYTLQELFRLARANVLQQRVAALNSIAGILNIYNQGFYDGILELPISKIFFFLRFALDENTPAIVEAAARALAYLFYNDSDEALLDIVFEAPTGLHQPAMERNKSSSETLEDAFSDLAISENTLNKPFASTFQDDEFEKEKESINDFHLAEIDLIECLMRTNILERIRYILGTIRPGQMTVNACVKILIRLARTNKGIAMKILMMQNLMTILMKEYLPSFENAKEPCHLIMKLCRVIASHDVAACFRVKKAGALEIAKGYIFSRTDINMRFIQMQIESFRYIRLYLTLIPDTNLFTDLLPAIRYMLEWHYQNLIFEANGSYLIRQHAAAVLNILQCGNNISLCYSMFLDILEVIFCKWFNSATRCGIEEFSQKILLASCLELCGKFMRHEPNPFYTFVDNYLRLFMESKIFNEISCEIRSASCLLNGEKDRSNVYNPLPNLGAIITRSKTSQPSLIFSKNYPSFLLYSLLNFFEKLSIVADTQGRQHHLYELIFNENIMNFICTISQKLNNKLSTNWFAKIDILLLLNLIKAAESNKNLINKKILLHSSYNILSCFSQEMITSILFLFDKIIFNQEFYTGDIDVAVDSLQKWKNTYKDTILSSIQPSKIFGKSMTVYEWKHPLLNKSWPYHLLSTFLAVLEATPNEQKALKEALHEYETIETVLGFTELLEKSGIQLASPTERLMYLMTAFLGAEAKFLTPELQILLKQKAITLLNDEFDFEMKFEGKKSFEGLYTIFIDTFQSTSYGDELFSALLMVPLAQKYDVKWRKRVWSEHVAVLRFITCDKQQLFGGIEAYISPEETDVSLLKCYNQALNGNILRKGSVPYTIAEHHLNNFRMKKQTNDMKKNDYEMMT